jgi:hypothetical protein
MRVLRTFVLGAAIGGGLAAPAAAAPAVDCATSLKAFVVEMDTVLAKNPNDVLDVYAVIDRHLPVRGCTSDEASRIVRTSAYFQGDEMNRANIRVFSFGSMSQFPNAISVEFGLTDAGDSNLPHAMWWPPRFEEADENAAQPQIAEARKDGAHPTD